MNSFVILIIDSEDRGAATETYDQHANDTDINIIGDYDYEPFIEDYDKDTTDSFSSVIDACIQDDATESGDRTDDPRSQPYRVDSCPRRARRGPPGQRVPGTRPTRGACVCCPEALVVQCGGLRRPSIEQRGDSPRASAPVASHRIKPRRMQERTNTQGT